MPCDPNTLLEQAKCLNACIPQGMMAAVNTSLLCQIAGAGSGGGGVTSFNARTGAVTLTLGDVSAVADAQYVNTTGDTMTGALQITMPAGGFAFGVGSLITNSSITYQNGLFSVQDTAGDPLVRFDGDGLKIAFFATGAVAIQQVSGANLTNNVTVGGVNDIIADFTSLTVYATDAAAIRNDIYQLARKLKQINDGLRAYGLFT